MSAYAQSARNSCRRCGADAGQGNPRPNSCGKCPPVACADCGESDDRSCRCWVPLEGMPLADIKALFATVDLSIAPAPAPEPTP